MVDRDRRDSGRAVAPLIVPPDAIRIDTTGISEEQVINRIVETVRRGVYTGCIGWYGRDGSAELSIAIRTLVLEGGFARIHAGGGIVIDSDPLLEQEECLGKVRGLVEGLGGEFT